MNHLKKKLKKKLAMNIQDEKNYRCLKGIVVIGHKARHIRGNWCRKGPEEPLLVGQADQAAQQDQGDLHLKICKKSAVFDQRSIAVQSE